MSHARSPSKELQMIKSTKSLHKSGNKQTTKGLLIQQMIQNNIGNPLDYAIYHSALVAK